MNPINSQVISQKKADKLLAALENADNSRPKNFFETVTNLFQGRKYEYVIDKNGEIDSSIDKLGKLDFVQVTRLVKEVLDSNEVSHDTKKLTKNSFEKMIGQYQEKHNNFFGFLANLLFFDFPSAAKIEKARKIIDKFEEKSNKKLF